MYQIFWYGRIESDMLSVSTHIDGRMTSLTRQPSGRRNYFPLNMFCQQDDDIREVYPF